MAGVKRMMEKMAEQGLKSFIATVTFVGEMGIITESHQYWAEDAGHAGEQADDAFPYCDIELIETQEEFEKRTGVLLDYGRLPNL